jgi:Ricin-type beta-trefoil lectin domain
MFGGYQCADMTVGNLAAYTPVRANDCNAAPNQQFEFNGFTIYALGGQRCLDVFGFGTAAGTPVDSYSCNGTPAQIWYYYNGEI